MHSKYVTFGRIYLNLNGRSTMKAGILIITGPVPVLPDLRILKLAISYCIGLFIFKYTYLIITETHCCMRKRGGSKYHVIT